MKKKVVPFGATRMVTVDACTAKTLIVTEDQNREECHILIGTGHNPKLEKGDKGMVTFKKGGPFGGYWEFSESVKEKA